MLTSYYSNGAANPDLVHPTVTRMNPELDLSPLNNVSNDTSPTATATTSPLKTRPLEAGEHQYLNKIHENVLDKRNNGSYTLAGSEPVVPKSAGVSGTTLGVGAAMGANEVKRNPRVAPAEVHQPGSKRGGGDGWEMDDLDERYGSRKSASAGNGRADSGNENSEISPNPFWAIGNINIFTLIS